MTALRIPVEFDEALASGGPISKRQLYDAIEEELGALMSPVVPLEELVVEVVKKRNEQGGPKVAKADYEMRYGRLSFPERGLLGHVTVDECRNIIRAEIQSVWKRIKEEQQNADWVLVAARCFHHEMTRLIDLGPGGRTRPSWLSSNSFLAQIEMVENDRNPVVGANAKTQRNVRDSVEYNAVIELAFADIAQSAHRDVYFERTGKPGPYQQYIDSGNLRHLPQALQAERAAALALCKRVIDYNAETKSEEREVEVEASPEIAVKGKIKINEEQISAAIALREIGKEWDYVATALRLKKSSIQSAVSRALKQAREAEAAKSPEQLEAEAEVKDLLEGADG